MQKGKAVDTNVLQKPSTVGDDVQPSLSKNKLSVDDIGDDNDDDNGDGSEHLGQKDDSVPFFTIDASEQGVNASKSAADIESESANRSVTASDQAGEVEMYYDPSSGYYYDHTSGLYYYYDTDSCRYIDARSLYQSESGEQIGSIHTEDKQSLESNIDKADIEKLIGRSAFKRGEANAMIGMAVRDLSHRSQLSGSDYSDSKAGAEFAAKRAAETRRRATHTVIEGESVDKKKKQKHNIMYLALQAQEQESNLKEAHANRKSARKAARSKYGL
ncbi:hypothetical protein EV175_000852 [Coemansia sp. RSA 1933]|nr:hypothetical protein EV175_000852 [Coemansia sp. RSA 1933]